MRWEGRRKSTNVQDMRSAGRSRSMGRRTGARRVRIPASGRPVRSSGGGLSTIVIIVVLFFVLRSCGIDPLQILAGGSGGASPFDQMIPQSQTNQVPRAAPTNDEQAEFAATVKKQIYLSPTRQPCGFSHIWPHNVEIVFSLDVR